MLVVLTACGRRNQFINPVGTATPGKTVIGPPVATSSVWILGRSGASPPDTTVAFNAKAGRIIVMRHEAPDNSLFAILDVPPGAVVPRGGDSAHVRLVSSPGRYGLTIETTDSLGAGIQLTFSYATHFQEPSEAIAKYPTPGQFEQATSGGRVVAADQFQFVSSTRPAADMIRFPVTAAGVWLLAARR